MFRFRKKRGEESESKKARIFAWSRNGKAMLETVRAGLNSQWFRGRRYSILKEFEGRDQKKGLIDDRSRERAIASIISTLEGAVEALAADDDREGLREAASLSIEAYKKIGNPSLLDTYMDACTKAGMTEEEITGKLTEAADSSNQIDIAITLYCKAGVREKLIIAGHKALKLYLEADEMDMETRSRLFDYVVEAYKAADDNGSLIKAGDEALKNQLESRRLSREKDWVLDAQKAYEAADAKDKLAALGNQYVNLYLREGLEMWLDKAVAVYKEAEVDFVSRLGKLADRVEEKGRSSMADVMRRKAGLL